MALRKRVSLYPHLGIVIPPIVLKNVDTLQWYRDIHPSKKTRRLNTAYPLLGIATLTSLGGTNLDKKGHYPPKSVHLLLVRCWLERDL
ncbi:hypothetical protein J1N35_024802 [Gossypium stocksii]|uniref:Uncharacterized protein n=1 Tax=Gossypium stocksii TaxID=47602 RepID=A0A9D3V581_9ROSI|nr:hypothetical protein J1N35_024802 [Gossypium stocksii]